MRACRSCAATAADGAAFPPGRGGKPAGYCCDCIIAVNRTLAADRVGSVIRRASYRTALRHRQKSRQSDLVDLVTPCP